MWTIGRSQRVEEKNIDLSSVKYGSWFGWFMVFNTNFNNISVGRQFY
jgi:hypothetical protein